MKIQQIRSATLKIFYGGQTILLDPWLQDPGTGFSAQTVRPEMAGLRCPLVALPMAPEEVLSGVDFCLVTHIHPDHFTPEYLPKTTRLIVQNRADRQEAASMGFTDVLAFEGDTLRLGAVTLTRVPAVHGEREEVARAMGVGSGYILSGESRTLYIAGDTVYCSDVAHTLDFWRPDVVAVNCCAATLPLGRLIMDLADLEAVCKRAPEALVLATHLDGVNHALLTGNDVRNLVRTRGLTQVRVPKNGEIVEL